MVKQYKMPVTIIIITSSIIMMIITLVLQFELLLTKKSCPFGSKTGKHASTATHSKSIVSFAQKGTSFVSDVTIQGCTGDSL